MAAADHAPILADVVRDQRRSLVLWGVSIAAISAMYIGLYPSMGAGGQMAEIVENLPEAMVEAFGYDRIGTPGGWMTSTVYGLIGPVLLLVFAIGTGARLIAGREEDGTLELDLTGPVSRRRVLLERLAALWFELVLLVAVVTLVALAVVTTVDMEVGAAEILAGGTGLLLLVGGFGTVAFGVGAATGRRAQALGVASALAVVAYVFDALGPSVGAEWMTVVSPFSWYLEGEPLTNGFDPAGLAKLAVIPVVAVAVGLYRYVRRDLMV